MKLTKGKKPDTIPKQMKYKMITQGTYSEVETDDPSAIEYFKSKGYK